MREVRRLRQERDWNQTELAFHANLAPSVISEIETGKRDPSAGTLRKLASALDVDVPDLFERSDPLKDQAPLPFNDESVEQRREEEYGRALASHVREIMAHAEEVLRIRLDEAAKENDADAEEKRRDSAVTEFKVALVRAGVFALEARNHLPASWVPDLRDALSAWEARLEELYDSPELWAELRAELADLEAALSHESKE